MERVVQPRLQSEDASSRTVRERARFMRDARTRMSGGSTLSSATQLAAELQQTSRKERELALQKAGVFSSGRVSAEECLAMKSTLAIPWHKLRHIRRWVQCK